MVRDEGHSRPSGSEYADALSAVLEADKQKRVRSQQLAAARARRRPRVSGTWILGLVAVATGAWAWYDYRLPPGPPTAASQRRAALILAHATVNAVEAHRQATGLLPEDLSILDLSRGDWSYIRADTGYTLVLTLHDVVLVYRSGDDHQAFLDQAGVR